ncbi:3-phenylpropionate-dihydrodiol/cinnamic acid-dihydrodiol dehydrogenase [Periweissella fabaria]|uniref:3-phenylpropionate-dihydrodiol/cinnamic acid-dihydrodiol dehydrogenase n=1 Tax=Periweissella fabaria TaxID=546157 RepID=A0ABM8Z9L2_9LACO|nr:SDR family oxidoreductase [Periweissella fabaria]CAH0417521.1 3-phenylpropionate-dihydrodiol/cinnamic acid-dihydrodiol dehydrogenase [Periweissella fabaria]
MKTILITGGGNGFGLALVKQFLYDGWKVITTYHSEASCQRLIKVKNKHLTFQKLLLESQQSIDQLLNYLVVNEIKLDVLVNNAATSSYVGPVDQVPDSDWFDIMNINFHGQRRMITGLLNNNSFTEKPSIINITSQSATTPFNLLAPYGVSKAALEAYTLYLSKELNSKGIRVNSIGISADTDLYLRHATIKAKYGYTKTLERMKTERLPNVQESIGTVQFLASSYSQSITGQHIEASSMLLPFY